MKKESMTAQTFFEKAWLESQLFIDIGILQQGLNPERRLLLPQICSFWVGQEYSWDSRPKYIDLTETFQGSSIGTTLVHNSDKAVFPTLDILFMQGMYALMGEG